jgi:DNA helicase-2/ATP-dependent DNA helicase PcrA
VSFAALIQTYSARAAAVPVGTLVEALVEELDLLENLKSEGPEGEDRAENVKEMVAGALEFDAEALDADDPETPDTFTQLDLFLQRVALVADIDRHDPEADAVTLMTLHNAKGLEFPVVFITGLEEGLFPLSRAYDEPGALEEERRLFYVGITRACDRLYLVHARRRRRGGEYLNGQRSHFVASIPPALIQASQSNELKREPAFRGMGGRDRGRGDDSSWVRDDPEPWYDQDSPSFVKGERVAHPSFGSGTILELSGFGSDTKVTVDFDQAGRKKLVVRYAHLERDYDL